MTPRNWLPAALAAALALTACGPGSPEAGRPNTAPPSVSTTPTGSATTPGATAPSGTTGSSPTRPQTAEGPSLSAGEAFIGYYVELMNYSYETGNPQALLAEADKGCLGCKGFAEYTRKVNAKNGGLTGDYKDRLTSVKEIFRGTDGKVGGSAALKSGVFQERTSPSAAPVSHDPGTGSMEFTLSARDGNWVMYEMQIKE
ncbi:hypothetical protein E1263_32860 [Kribbella antibiotica]|uniref:DUF6318 domain-containing protein n=1 Tax=Kribbella antibiotica TaxID=190195 RepID=A0A4R4YVI2_9ACTN|nr:DUF6318 family protein [Kribbella antibiotica]TDD48850.1 hypothetical protein E1263_32860 [Kribbella antibiotica]